MLQLAVMTASSQGGNGSLVRTMVNLLTMVRTVTAPISEWPYCMYICKAVQRFLNPEVKHHVRVRVRLELELGLGSTCHPLTSDQSRVDTSNPYS